MISKDIAAPNFKVKGVINGRTVTFQSKTPGTQIYYSTSSSLITKKDKKVENGESVTFSNYYGTVYARTYKDGVWSNVSKLILKIPVVTTPTIRRVYEGIEKTNFMILETETPDCIIYYTTDGTNPSPKNGTRVDASSVQIKLEPEWKVIKMIAVRSCFTNSKIVSYTIQ